MRELTPTLQDVQALIAVNPLAGEQLKALILARLLTESEQQLESQNSVSSNGVVEPATLLEPEVI